MKKLLGLAAITTVVLTGCSVNAKDAITTFETNLAGAESVEISYQTGNDDFTLTTGQEVKFADLETLTKYNSANTNEDEILTYDEALTAVTESVSGLVDDMDTYKNSVSKNDGNTAIEFEVEGFLSDEAGGTQTYSFAEDGMSAMFKDHFVFKDGTEAEDTTITITLN